VKITKQVMDGEITLSLDGELDLATVGRLGTAVNDALAEDQPRYLLLDLKALTFCDSTGIGGFVAAHETARDAGVPLRLRHAEGLVRHALEVTGMRALLTTD
jgi:anti-sigma B factor antagonist